MTKLNPMWSGRFSTPSSDLLQKINESISFDVRLAKYDILGSKAHCKMLTQTGILTEEEDQLLIFRLFNIIQSINTEIINTTISDCSIISVFTIFNYADIFNWIMSA